MKGVVERLNYVWSTLLTSNLVQDPNASSDENIAEFGKLLNKSAPVTPAEKTSHEVVRYIFLAGKEEFVQMISKRGMAGLILACDGTTIGKELGVAARVDIRWSANLSEYTVAKSGSVAWGDTPAPNNERGSSEYRERGGQNRGEYKERRDRDDNRGRGEYRERRDRDDNRGRGDSKGRGERGEYRERGDSKGRGERGEYRERGDGKGRGERSEYRERRNNQDRDEKPVSKYDKNRNREKPEKSSVRNNIPPISTQDQVEILKQLHSIKTYSEKLKSEPAAEGRINIPADAPANTPPVVITSDDIKAINTVLEM